LKKRRRDKLALARSRDYIDPRSCIIYAIRNKLNNDAYVGSTVRGDRWIQHRDALNGKIPSYEHHCIKLREAWLAYGEESFEWIILEDMGPVSGAARDKREVEWIAEQGTYNTVRASETHSGFEHPQDVCDKIGAASLKSWQNEAIRARRIETRKRTINLPENKTKWKQNTADQWVDQSIRDKMLAGINDSWTDPVKRQQRLEKAARARALTKTRNANLKALAKAKATVEACIKSIETQATL